MHEVRSTGAGVKEESYYGALETLLNAVGTALKPRVRCIGQLANQGAGEPDFGLFTQEQFQKGAAEPLPGQKPARGVIEGKGLDEAVTFTANSEQVLRYLQRYGLVLVTNYRDFLLIGIVEGRPTMLESYTLADSAATFWSMAVHPRKAASEHGEAFFEFLQRVMLFNAPLSAPKDVAWFLASYAREARARVAQANVPALDMVRKTLEDALGLSFKDEKGQHFFQSTLVQTLFYGLFAAWVLWQQRGERGRFDWRSAGWELHVPMIQSLYEQLSQPQRLRPLGLEEILSRAAALLNRINPEEFFAQFKQEHAVQYFYEPFLQAFDPELRKELGVWYTPPEIVEYMVARVDTVLREELGIADGLANPDVYILDPCCGTGAFLVEVLRRIRRTLDMENRALGALVDLKVKDAAMHRIFGFEILPAPFVIAHLQLGLLLHTLGGGLSDTNERVGVYLTNALTGWESPTGEAKQRLDQLTMFSPEIRQEVDAAAQVKQGGKILVIIGNPPYNGFAGVAMAEERDLTNAYRSTTRAPKPQGQGLNDLYIRFYRMAERQIVEKAQRGVVCFISNYSWLDGLSFTGMREHYLEEFDHIWIDCLNGDKFKTGKTTPAGKPDPSVFSTEQNHEGIQIGTTIGLLVRSGLSTVDSTVRFRHLWGRGKREELLKSLEATPYADLYEEITPPCALGLPFTPAQVTSSYLLWPLLPELFPEMSPGVNTSRDIDLVEIDLDRLRRRIELYFEPLRADEDVRIVAPYLMSPSARFDPIATRRQLLLLGIGSGFFVRYCYRPFDLRYLYWHPGMKLLDEKREDLFRAFQQENLFMTSRQKAERQYEGSSFYFTRALADRHLTRPGCACFPLFSMKVEGQANLFEDKIRETASGRHANLSDNARAYLAGVGVSDPDASYANIDLLWMHALAVGHTPAYLKENSSALWQDWPRIPLPANLPLLHKSTALGRQVASLLDPEQPVTGIDTGQLRPELWGIGLPIRADGGSLRVDDLALTACWGYAGQGGVTMPGPGKVAEREYTTEERAALLAACESHTLSETEIFACLGETTFDIYLNDIVYWRNVPANVWAYTLGGYQVMKKWLSYREEPLLGRALTQDEVIYVANIARRISALLLLGPALDRVYQQVKMDTYMP